MPGYTPIDLSIIYPIFSSTLKKVVKAAVFHKPKDISFDQVEDPKIIPPDDVLLRVTSNVICGPDLHIYNGFFPQVNDLGMGHEFMG